MSLFGQHLENISQALTLLNTAADSQYDIRGQPHFDKVILICLV